MSEWIPVATPPKEAGHYIAFDAGHGSCTAFYEDGKWTDCFGYHDAPVTHWKHLEEPPQ
jgi:hypothetical protein